MIHGASPRVSDRLRVFVGFSADEMMATTVAINSMLHFAGTLRLNVQRISRLSLLQCYTRPTRIDDNGQLWDEISDAPMSTDHAIARFFIPWLRDYQGWALFTDGDVLCRRDVRELFALADERYAVMCVQHPPLLSVGYKKDGDRQLAYPRKNWSSVMLWNCGHPANRHLTLDTLNGVSGKALHGFVWLEDSQIGALPPEWNWLVGLSAPVDNPAIVHYTQGLPTLPDHAHDPYADEWFAQARRAGYAVEQPPPPLEAAG